LFTLAKGLAGAAVTVLTSLVVDSSHNDIDTGASVLVLRGPQGWSSDCCPGPGSS